MAAAAADALRAGMALLERGAHAEAVRHFAQARRDDYVGYALMVAGRMPEAERVYVRHLELAPGDAAAYFNLGNAQREQATASAASRARRSYELSIRLAPSWADPYINLGVSLRDDMAGALVAYTSALKLEPTHPHALCNAMHASTWLAHWRGRDALLRRLRSLLERASAPDATAKDILLHAQPWHLLAYHQLPTALSRIVAFAHADAAVRGTARRRHEEPAAHRRRARRLRLVYLSSDLDEAHPVGQLMSRVFGLHDRTRFRVECFATSTGNALQPATSPTIVEGCDRFMHLASEEGGALLRARAGDVLLDLNGHTEGSRLDLLAARLAPVQALAIGYPSGLGGQLVDYLTADAASVWAGDGRRSSPSADFSERLVLLPSFFLVADHGLSLRIARHGHGRRGAARGTAAAARCVLSSFSQPYKLMPETLQAWVGALARLGARCSLALVRFHPSSVPRIQSEFAALGTHTTRLQWWPMLPRQAHVNRAAAALLSLDTPGYNQGTSGLDALWAGLPLLTLPLRLWCSRMGAGLLRTASLPSGEARSMRAFEDMATALIATTGGSLRAARRRNRKHRAGGSPFRAAPARIAVERLGVSAPPARPPAGPEKSRQKSGAV